METTQHTYIHQQQARLDRIRRVARLMDARYRVPGTSYRIGLDGLIGLIPGVGDTVGLAVSGWMISEAVQAGARRRTIARMAGNAVLDWAVGIVPVAGDLFDFAFKSHQRNAALLAADLERMGAVRPASAR
ncbi:DUF4112 domain-containing protein [Frigidibacter sp.]|uniref:DUF4112 domain-containing protein n=1 Tax=Frigidibacter sp. TaxID=2586418 RepID=UPI0027357579|nr:DUF4112 domain-containing protein [Frigidibacter sp.]MDP3341601.1 DUF4112 domain-containing protein [Frigidibacter sp.]